MKNRNIPFGFILQNGEIVLHEQEAKAVKQIFSLYLQGESLQAVADAMDVPYSAASPDWNKHKVKRVLDNPRYIGIKGYPTLVNAHDYDTAQRLKTEKNVCVPVRISEEIGLLKPHTYCQICGERIIRYPDNRYGERWRCRPECENAVSLRDSDLLRAVTDAMNTVIQNPSILQTASSPRPASLTVNRLQNEINREMDKVNADMDNIRKLLFTLAAEKYTACDNDAQVTLTLREVFENHDPINQFDNALFERTVERAMICKDGTASLLLKNGQVISMPQNQEGSHIHANANAS